MWLLENKELLSPIATFAGIVTGAMLAIAGWMVNAKLNRRHHIFQKRLEKRMTMFDDVVQAIEALKRRVRGTHLDTDPEVIEILEKAGLSLRLYGYEDEVTMYENFVEAFNKRDIEKINATLPTLPLLLRKLREELGYLDKLKILHSSSNIP